MQSNGLIEISTEKSGLAKTLIGIIENSDPFRKLLASIEKKSSVTIGELPGSMPSAIIAALAQNKPVIVVAPDSSRGEALLDDLYPLLGENEVCFLPPGGKSKLRRMTTESVEHHRAETFRRVAQNPPSCLVTLPGTLLEKFPALEALKQNILRLANGFEISPQVLLKRMMNAGFKREVQVEGCGELALRGGIMDLFPFGRRNPFRLEFWGDEIVSIREFDPRSQRSIREIDTVELMISRRIKESGSVFDLMGGVVFWEGLKEIEERYFRLIESEISPLYLVPDGRVSIEHEPLARAKVKFGGSSAELFLGDETGFIKRAGKLQSEGKRVFVGAESDYRFERLADSLNEIDRFTTEKLEIGILPLQKGFVFPAANTVFFTERELYDRPRPRRSFAKFRTYAHPVEPEALKSGDYVVHVDYGIGIFQGLKTIKVAGHERECLHINYKNNVSLYVRLEAFSKVQKYSGREGFVPAVNKIGGKDWEKIRSRTKKALLDMAKELLVLQAKREVKKGFAFQHDDVWQKQMEDAFIYEDTADQKRATDEIKQDMEKDQPMDRLLLGDVGFGKTEVAVRAAFKAIQSNRQVAVLAPTTILVQQHAQTFKDRMSSFPVNIESLSRFRPPAEQRKVVQGLRNGSVDVVIGTHRLLSRDVAFRRLGLVIIDEEHRFGVRHKEKLKKLREEVDVLTLTATPIPRTLHYALTGSRDMSRIETPPEDRLSIVTEILPFDKGLIREGIMFEIKRGGQVFFIHNRVRSIEAVRAMLSRTVPEARYAVAHGQMSPRELEKVMVDFIEKKVDVLVCTMIVESGIDLPNVNTMIINRADKLGLAQLYQLRGRIGRSERQAFAYLLIPPKLGLSSQARSRLETIAMFTDLGAGFQVALKDLEIRGAGNLLGSQQSGFINSIGYDLYSSMLGEAVEEIRKEQGIEAAIEKEPLKPPENGIKVDFAGNAHIPSSYIEDQNLRVNFYRRMSKTGTSEELRKLEVEMEDRFGQIPLPLINLFGTLNLKLLASLRGVSSVDVGRESLKFEIVHSGDGYKKIIEGFVKALGNNEIEFNTDPVFQVTIHLDPADTTSPLKAAEEILESIKTPDTVSE